MNQNLTECCEITTLGVINILLVKTRQSVTAYFWWSFGSLLDNRKGSYESGTGNNMADTAISFLDESLALLGLIVSIKNVYNWF